MSSGYIEPYKTYKGYIIAPGATMPSHDIHEYEIFRNFGQYEEHNPAHTAESELEAERWVDRQLERTSDQAIDEFLRELEELCRKHNLSLAHEDAHGAFIIQKLDERNIRWVNEASRQAKYQ